MLSATTRLIALPVRLTPVSSEYDHSWHRETLAILAQPTVSSPVNNGTAGLTRLADSPSSGPRVLGCHFDHAPDSCPSRALIVAFDVPFYGLASPLAAEHRVSLVNVARSTASLHGCRQGTDRLERSGLQAAASGHVATISQAIRNEPGPPPGPVHGPPSLAVAVVVARLVLERTVGSRGLWYWRADGRRYWQRGDGWRRVCWTEGQYWG